MIKVGGGGGDYRVYVWKRKGEGYILDLYGEKKQFSQITFQSHGMGVHTVSERFLLWTAISTQRNTWIHSRRICSQLLRNIFLRVAKYFKVMWHRRIGLTSSRLGKE